MGPKVNGGCIYFFKTRKTGMLTLALFVFFSDAVMSNHPRMMDFFQALLATAVWLYNAMGFQGRFIN